MHFLQKFFWPHKNIKAIIVDFTGNIYWIYDNVWFKTFCEESRARLKKKFSLKKNQFEFSTRWPSLFPKNINVVIIRWLESLEQKVYMTPFHLHWHFRICICVFKILPIFFLQIDNKLLFFKTNSRKSFFFCTNFLCFLIESIKLKI